MRAHNLFTDRLNEKTFLILSHRGFWGGNVIENTRVACQLAYRAGADIAEVDVCRSSDGEYYLFHDGNEAKLLNKRANFSELDAATIDSINLLNSLGNSSGYKVEKLADFLSWLPVGKLVNIDRSWDYWEDDAFYHILSASQKSDQVLLKSPVKKAYLSQLNARYHGISYMPIITSQEEYDRVLNYPLIQMIGVEIVVSHQPSDLLNQNWLNVLAEKGLMIVANAEKLGESYALFNGLDDDVALANGFSTGWGQILASGANTIQTDWPNFLNDFRLERERKPIHDAIEK